MAVIQPKQKISKKLFEECLMIKHNGDIRISKRDKLYIYFTSDKHCGTWIKGKGWEFPNG